MIQFPAPGDGIWRSIEQFWRIWEGGLIFYGSAVGGLIGYCSFIGFCCGNGTFSSWKIADILAPSVALGLCLGRIGCFLNGCCYGNVACADCPKVHFPMCSPPRFTLTAHGLQPAANFTMKEFADGVPGDDRTIGAVEFGSQAETAGLQAGDIIVKADGRPINRYRDLYNYLYGEWPRGKSELQLTVRRGNEEIDLPAYEPWTLGLHPTQLYEAVSTFLLFLLVSAYYPFPPA